MIGFAVDVEARAKPHQAEVQLDLFLVAKGLAGAFVDELVAVLVLHIVLEILNARQRFLVALCKLMGLADIPDSELYKLSARLREWAGMNEPAD